MVHMERDAPVMDEQTKPESRWAARKRLAREHAAEVEFHALQHRLARNEKRMQLELYRRRYEFPTGARTGGARPKIACPHLLARHYDEAHPRYGDRFPITRTVLRPVRGKHVCVAGVTA